MGDEPGVALVGGTPATVEFPLDYAASSRAPMLMVAMDPLSPPASSSLKGSMTLSPEFAARGTAQAIRLALRPPWGPVQLVLPVGAAERPAVPVATAVRPEPLPAPDPGVLDEAARRLAAAAHPVLVIGLQCRGGDVAKWLRPLAETLPAPVLVTPRARGVLPDPHPLNLGTVGEGGALLVHADLVVTVGVEVSEVVSLAWPPAAARLHLRITPSAVADGAPIRNALDQPSVEVVGDIALVIEELAPRLRGRSRADWDVAALDRLKRQVMAARPTASGPARLVAIARDAAPAGTIAAADPGFCEGAVAAAWQTVGPNELLVAGEAVLHAFAATAALAAQLARPERRALSFTDAAGLADGQGTLAVIARLGAPVVVIVLGAPGPSGPAPVAAPLGIATVSAPTEPALARGLAGALARRAPCLIDARSPSV
jgi:acetolactate synthase-1/2/3 large subunit